MHIITDCDEFPWHIYNFCVTILYVRNFYCKLLCSLWDKIQLNFPCCNFQETPDKVPVLGDYLRVSLCYHHKTPVYISIYFKTSESAFSLDLQYTLRTYFVIDCIECSFVKGCRLTPFSNPFYCSSSLKLYLDTQNINWVFVNKNNYLKKNTQTT